jgi:hypothetical protein
MPWLAGDTPFGIIDDLSGILGHVFFAVAHEIPVPEHAQCHKLSRCAAEDRARQVRFPIAAIMTS